MADEFDVANWLFGGRRLETSRGDSAMHACMGTATSDSDSGRVSVAVGDDATTVKVSGEGSGMGIVEGDTSLDMPTTVHVKEGDSAIVAVVNHRPTVIGVVGRGDEEHDSLVDAQVEQEQAMAIIRESVASVKADADATSAKADELIAEIDDVTVTVDGVELKGLDNLVASIQGSIDKGDANAEAITTVEQTINSFTVSSGKGYKDLVSTLKADSSLTITPDEIKGVVTKNYMSTTLGDTYTSLATVKQNADSIISEVSTSALNNAIGTSYVASSSTIQTASQITTKFNEQGGQITAQGTRVTNLESYIRLCTAGVLVGQTGKSVAALVNSQGTFDVVTVTWSNGEPTIGAKLMTLSDDLLTLGRASSYPKVNFGSSVRYIKGIVDQNGLDGVEIHRDGTNADAIIHAVGTNNSAASSIQADYGSGSTAKRAYVNVTADANGADVTIAGDTYLFSPIEAHDALTMLGNHVFYRSLNITEDTVPSSNTWGNSRVVFRDSHGDTYGQIGLYHSTADKLGIVIGAGRDNVSNYLYMTVNGTGGAEVSVNSASAWRKGLGTLWHEAGTSFSDTWWGAGYLTNGGKDFEFTIPLVKASVKAGVFTKLQIRARQGGNYVLGTASTYYDAVADGNATITATYGSSGIHTRVRLASAVAGTNNDMVGLDVAYTFLVNS